MKLIPVANGEHIANTTVVMKWGEGTFTEGNNITSIQVFVWWLLEEDCS